MRTPLQSMIYLVEQIIDILCTYPVSPGLEQACKYGIIIKSQLDLMETFVDDLLDLTQLREGVFSLVKEPFDQEDVVSFILNMFAPRAQAKGITIRRKYLNSTTAAFDDNDCDLERYITHKSSSMETILLMGDERRYKQVLINLVKNAIKFT